MKEKTTVMKDDFKVFTSLINLLLFETLETPNFDSNIELVSINYSSAKADIELNSIEMNDFVIEKLILFLNSFTKPMRNSIFNIISEDEIYLDFMFINFMLGSNDISDNLLPQKSNFIDLMEFKLNGKISRVVVNYFIFLIDSFFDFQFEKHGEIKLQEYYQILSFLKQKKS